MTRGEVKALLDALVEKYEGRDEAFIERRAEPYDAPTRADWEFLESRFNCSFSPEFVHFMELMPAYHLPGLLNVTRSEHASGNANLDEAYDHEMSFGRWNPDLLPFLDISNGDFYCLSISRGAHSPVYYVYHEGGEEEVTPSFAEWLGKLEELF